MSLSKREFGEILVCGILALVVGAASFGLQFWLRPDLKSDVLTAAVGATGQLLAFGAVILALVYPVQRSILGDLNNEILKWEGAIDLYPADPTLVKKWVAQLPRQYQTVTPFKRAVQLAIAEVRVKVSLVQRNYQIAMAGLSWALMIWACSLILELIHLSIFSTVSTGLQPYWGFALIATELFLLSFGLGIFITALMRSIYLALV